MTRMMSTSIALLSVVIATACAQSARFRPVDAPESVPPQLAGMEYELAPDGQNVGDVKVWSEGATTTETNGEQRVVHLGLRIRNDDPQRTLRFDPERTTVALISDAGELIELDRPYRVEGDLSIEPGSMGRLDVEYPLPDRIDVYDVAGFEFNWAVDTGDTVATHSTTFVREQERGDRMQYGVGVGYYDPYWGYPYHYPPYRL